MGRRRFYVMLSLVVLSGLGLAGWRYLRSPDPPAGPVQLPRAGNPRNHLLADSATGLLRNGDVVLRAGADATSNMLRGLNRRDRRFSHCGIVVIENDTPFVYHSIGGEDNPSARLRREPARSFFSPVSNERLGIARLDLDSAQLVVLTQTIRHWQEEGRLFDMDFDLRSDERLYCTEMVYKSVRLAASDTAYFGLSSTPGRVYVGVDDLFLSRHVKLVCDIPYQ